IITEVSPANKKIRIGDTIVLKGDNLGDVKKVGFITIHGKNEAGVTKISDNEIRVIVPKLKAEEIKLSVALNSSNIEKISFNLIGTFELKSPQMYMGNVEMVSEDIIYIAGGNKLLKSTDGGYTWIEKYSFTSIRNMCFIN